MVGLGQWVKTMFPGLCRGIYNTYLYRRKEGFSSLRLKQTTSRQMYEREANL